MKFLIVMLFTTAAFASSTAQIAKTFEGEYTLYADGEGCRPELSARYHSDGDPVNCANGQGPRLVLGSKQEDVIECLDSKDKHGSMDTYTCNFVWDSKTSKKNGKNIITVRYGRKCLIMPTKWSKIVTYTKYKESTISINTKDLENSEASSYCSYEKW